MALLCLPHRRLIILWLAELALVFHAATHARFVGSMVTKRKVAATDPKAFDVIRVDNLDTKNGTVRVLWWVIIVLAMLVQLSVFIRPW